MRLDTLLVHAIMTTGIAGMGLFIRSIHRNTRRERWISWLTWALCVGGFASAGFVMALFDWPPAKEYVACSVAGGGLGLVCGLAVGRFVWRYYRKEVEGEPDAD